MDNLFNSHPLSLCFLVNDLDRMTAWYKDVLGFEEGLRRKDLVFLHLHGYSIELVATQGSAKGELNPDPPARRESSGFSHFILHTDDLSGCEKYLAGKGILAMFPFEAVEAGFKFFFIRDLEGNLIQIMELMKKG